jgi:hypothetical protein
MNTKNILIFGSVLEAAIAFGSPGSRANTIHFDELGSQTANGLTFDGVSFGFQLGGVDSADATFGAFGPPTLTYVDGAVLEGNALGVLKLSFDAPHDHLSFGLAYDSFHDFTPAATITLFDSSGNQVTEKTMDTHTVIDFSEGQFVYDGALFSSAEIHFTGSSRFALDNLDFSGPHVPENPGPVAMITLLGLLGGHRLFCRRSDF